MSLKKRLTVAALTLSATGFIVLVQNEGYVEQAMVPTKNDRPTIGFGSTFNEDGSPVRMGESTTPVRALIKAKAHIDKNEVLFRESLKGAKLNQDEFDVYMDWTYQYGIAAWVNSSMRRNIMAENYAQACKSLLLYKFSGGYDCSTPGNRICSGVWKRQLERYSNCTAAQ